MFRKFQKSAMLLAFAGLLLTLCSTRVHASTESRQFQLNGGFGVFTGSEGLGAAFDWSLEPEFFFTKHNSLSFRFDLTVGGTDSAHLGARYRYYFDIPSAPKFNIFVGLGFGGIIGFHGGGLGDAAIPVFGFQYDLMKHFKLGSDFSFDIVFNGNNAAFAARLMPLVLKWAF
jgi:hypothetical protein